MSWLSQQNEEILRTESNPFDDPVETEECASCEGAGYFLFCDECGEEEMRCVCGEDWPWKESECPDCKGTGYVEVE